MFGPCSVRYSFLFFLVLPTFWRGRESWLLYFCCLSGVLETGGVLWLLLTVLCQLENPEAQF